MARPPDVAAAVGRGLVAGAAGTALMTVATTVEMKLRGRAPSAVPADAATKVLGVEPTGEREKERFSNLVHWAYGTAWGSLRGLLAAAGLPGPAAATVHFAAVWGGGLVLLPRLEVAPPVRQWGPSAVALDAAHHLVYACGASLAYAALAPERRRR